MEKLTYTRAQGASAGLAPTLCRALAPSSLPHVHAQTSIPHTQGLSSLGPSQSVTISWWLYSHTR